MPTWDELFELKVATQTALTSEEKRVRNYAKKIGKMHRTHGKGPDGATCRDCTQFFLVHLASDYPKCRLFGVTGGPGTDWQRRWPACGKFTRRAEKP